jgi:serine/threonine protein kinase
MAPEQALSFQQADIRADIYSLGCTLYFLMTGKAPFEGTLAQKLMKHQQAPPPPLPTVPAPVRAAFQRMMAKRPEDRFQSPGEIVEALAPFTAPFSIDPSSSSTSLSGCGSTPLSSKPTATEDLHSELLASIQAVNRRSKQLTLPRQQLLTRFLVLAGAVFVLFLGIGLLLLSWTGRDNQDNSASQDAPAKASGGSRSVAMQAQRVAVGDPGFESPVVGSGRFESFKYNPPGTAWKFSASSGVSGNGSGFTSGNPTAPEGAQVAVLQKTGTITQSVRFATGGSYVVSFRAAQRAHQASQQTFQVLIDSQPVGSITPKGISHALYATSTFTVTAGEHTLSFVGLNPKGGDNTAFIDQVQITSAPEVSVPHKTP